MYDNQQTRRWCLRAIGGAVGGAALLGTASADEHIVREEAVLTGEDHGIDTDASGRATFEVNAEEGTVAYQLHIDRICDPTQAHVHMGGPDEDGPVVTWLYPEAVLEPRHIEGLFQGTLAAGTITPDDFVGPLEGLSFEEAGAMLEEEGAYVNVHTEEYPGGEIRGQIEPVEEPPEDDKDAPPEDDEEEEPPEDDDDDDDDEEPAETFELDGAADGWVGVAPEAIAGETNPTLELAAGETYEVVWTNADGNPHNFVLETEADEHVVESPIMDTEGESQTVTFTATAEAVEYYCSVHPDTMVGDVEVNEEEMSISIAHRLGFSRSDPSARFGLHRF